MAFVNEMEEDNIHSQVEHGNERKLLFSINNTKQLVMIDLFWLVFFFLFVCVLWILFVNLDHNISKTSEELFLKEVYKPRFSSMLVILFIVGPIFTYFAIQKILKKDNFLYFYDDKIIYHDLVVNIDEIIDIKIGCCPIKGNIFIHIIIYILAGWFVIPLKIFEVFWFSLLKIIKMNNVKTYANHLLIVVKNEEKPIIGIVYSEKELIKLQKYIMEKGISNGR